MTIPMWSPADYWTDIQKEDYSCLPASNPILPHRSLVSPKHSGRYKKLQDQTFLKATPGQYFSRLSSSAAALTRCQHSHRWFLCSMFDLDTYYNMGNILPYTMGNILMYIILWATPQVSRPHYSHHFASDYHNVHPLLLIWSWQHRKPQRTEQTHRQ